MLRFLSRRKGRGTGTGTNQTADAQTNNTASQIKSQRILPNKSQIECRIILLDGTDLSVYLTVSTDYTTLQPQVLFFSSYFHYNANKGMFFFARERNNRYAVLLKKDNKKQRRKI